MPVDRLGRVDARATCARPRRRRGRRGRVQSANHEVGTLQPVAEARRCPTAYPLFIDACASMGRLPLPDGWSAAAGSAHKWGGPAGVGVLLVRKGARWRNPFPGDDRVDERVAGFENVPAALAAAAALQAVVAERDEPSTPASTALVDRIRDAASPRSPTSRWSATRSTGSPTWSPSPASTSTARRWCTELDRGGSGSPAGRPAPPPRSSPAHVLAAMGVLTHGNVRVSLTRDTTEADVDGCSACCPSVVADAIRSWSCHAPGRSRSTSSSTAAGCVCPMPVDRARPRGSPTSRSAASSPWSPTDAAARVDVPAWCRMRGQEYVGEDAAADGTPRYLVRRVS